MARKDKYQISYTLNGQIDYVTRVKGFSSKKAANQWLKENKADLYWHQLTEIAPKSKYPRPIIAFDPSEEFTLKIGKLCTYFETGMECMGLAFYEDGIHGPPNPSFDPSKPEGHSNFKFYASYDALNMIKHGDLLQIEDGPIYGMLKDRDLASRDGYRLSFYPQGFSREELLLLFGKENVKAKLWVKKDKK